MQFNGCLDCCDGELVAGWAMYPSNPDKKATIEVFTGQRLLGRCVADQYRLDLAEAGLGNGDHAFNFAPPPGLAEADIRAIRAMIPGSGYMFACGVPEPVLDVEITTLYRRALGPPHNPARRFSTCILHIGTEKTGSTTLQRLLHCNRGQFAQAGFFIPLSLAPEPGAAGINHCYLPTLAMDDHRFGDDLRATAGITDASTLLAYRRDIFSSFQDEIERAPADADTLIVSSEHCHSRLSSVQSIRHLKGFLDPFCENFKIVVYLRPQHEMAISRYGMFLLAGLTNIEMFPPLRPLPGYDRIVNTPPGYFDYAHLLDRWAKIFGEDAIDARLYGPATLLNGDIVEDFLSRLDIPGDRLLRPSVQNNNISAAAQDFLIRLHADPACRRIPPETLQAFGEKLRARFPGSGMLPARHEAEAFFAQFENSNEAVRARWFPHRQHVFECDFSRYPLEQSEPSRQDDDFFWALLGSVFDSR